MPAEKSEGSVLIFVLLFMALFLFLGGIYASQSLIETKVAYNHARNLKAYYCAEAGIEAALTLLQEDPARLEGEFLLEGTFPGGSFTLLKEEREDGITVTSRGMADGALSTIRVEIREEPLDPGPVLVVRELILDGAAVVGDLHVARTLMVASGENHASGYFSYGGQEAFFGEDASLMLNEYQLLATSDSHLDPFKVKSPLSTIKFNGGFYQDKGFASFASMEELLQFQGAGEDLPGAVLITGELDTSLLEENLSYHGVMVAASPADIVLAGSINSGEADLGNQILLVASDNQDIHIMPNLQGELTLGGSFILLTRGDVFVHGGSPWEPGGLILQGTVLCRRLTLSGATLIHMPWIEPPFHEDLRGLALLKVLWLKSH